jgi:hypothetical protein
MGPTIFNIKNQKKRQKKGKITNIRKKTEHQEKSGQNIKPPNDPAGLRIKRKVSQPTKKRA